MKKFLLIISLFVAGEAYAAAADVSVKVNGLVCDFCAQSITKTFKKEPSVQDVAVNLDDGLIIIDLKEGQIIDDDKITKLITDSGYTVTEIERAKQ